MATKCINREVAEETAREFRAFAWRPAVVEIITEDGSRQFWAVESMDDLDTVPGYVETITVV